MPHHHDQCFWEPPEALVDQTHYIGEIPDKNQKKRGYLLLANSDLPWMKVRCLESRKEELCGGHVVAIST